jgi:putative colanic acid biosynthesis UDP-glucose lipid carrier transferase
MTINHIPLISFYKNVLDPCIIIGTFVLISNLLGFPFSGHYVVLMVLCFFISTAIYKQIDPYRSWRNGHILAYARDIFAGWVLTFIILVLITKASGLGFIYPKKLIWEWFFVTPLLLLAFHLIAYKITAHAINARETRSIIIIGANDIGVKMSESIKLNPNLFMKVHGFFDDRSADRYPQSMRDPVLGTNDDVAAYVRKENIKMIFISQPISAQPRIRKLVDECKDTTASIYFIPDIYIFDLMQARFDNIAGMPIVAICESPFIGVNSLIKRTSDIILSIMLLPVLLPCFLVIGLMVKLTSPGPMIFKQRRYGLYGEEIIVYKFRTMTVTEDGGQIVQAKVNDSRLTSIGGLLRRSSLDELPQFINVLQGKMSIVGPRPHAVAHNEQYRKLIKGYMLRHKVKPGITGWAQVNGMRGETETIDKMQSRIDFDLNYIRNWSLWLDLWIVFSTLKVVLKRNNAH